MFAIETEKPHRCGGALNRRVNQRQFFSLCWRRGPDLLENPQASRIKSDHGQRVYRVEVIEANSISFDLTADRSCRSRRDAVWSFRLEVGLLLFRPECG